MSPDNILPISIYDLHVRAFAVAMIFVLAEWWTGFLRDGQEYYSAAAKPNKQFMNRMALINGLGFFVVLLLSFLTKHVAGYYHDCEGTAGSKVCFYTPIYTGELLGIAMMYLLPIFAGYHR